MLGLSHAGEREITETITRLRESCGIKNGLAARGVSRGAIDDLAPPPSRDACLFTNPRRASS